MAAGEGDESDLSAAQRKSLQKLLWSPPRQTLTGSVTRFVGKTSMASPPGHGVSRFPEAHVADNGNSDPLAPVEYGERDQGGQDDQAPAPGVAICPVQ